MTMISFCRALVCLCILFVMTGASCNKDKELPPETQTGADTFGCLINGNIFIPKGAIYTPKVSSYYQFLRGNGYAFQIQGFRNSSNQCEFTSIVINGDSVQIEEGKTYKIGTPSTGRFEGLFDYSPPDCNVLFERCITNDKLGGEINFTKFDQTNQIVSGTFWFDVLDKRGDTIKIRDGRFDAKYTR